MRIYRETMNGIPVRALPDVGVPPELQTKILTAITAARIRRLRNEFVATGFAFGIVIAAATASISRLVVEIRSSSIVGYLRLLISDSDIVFGNFREYLYGILESLPVGSIVFALTSVLLLLGAVAFLQALMHARRLSIRRGMPRQAAA